MINTNLDQVEQWLQAGQWEKVEKLFDELASRGKNGKTSLLDWTLLYAKVNKYLNQHYLESMKKTMAVLKKIDAAEAIIKKQIKIGAVKDKIKGMK